MDLCRKVVAERGLETLDIADPEPFDPRAPEEIALEGFGTVLFAGGFRPEYRSARYLRVMFGGSGAS